MPKPDKDRASLIILPFFSVLLAFTVWIVNKHLETDTRTIPVDVEYVNLPPFIDLERYEPERLLVTFNLKKADEFLIGQSDAFKAVVDLESLARTPPRSGGYEVETFRISPDNIRAPQELSFVRIDSSPSVDFSVQLMMMDAVVEPVFADEQPAQGYEIGSIEIEPETVQVAVSERVFRQFESGGLTIQTEPISIAGQKLVYTTDSDLVFAPDEGIYPDPRSSTRDTVSLTIDFPEQKGSRFLDGIPIRYEPTLANRQAAITPLSLGITLSGPVNRLREISSSNIRITPQVDRQLDEEVPGSVIEIALMVSLENVDFDIQEIDAVLSQKSAIIEFFEISESQPQPALNQATPATDDSEPEPDEGEPDTESGEMLPEPETENLEAGSLTGKKAQMPYFDGQWNTVLDTIYGAYGSGYPTPITPEEEDEIQNSYSGWHE